jgi:hypothetical protein
VARNYAQHQQLHFRISDAGYCPLLVSCCRAPQVNIGTIDVGAQPDPFNRCSIGADPDISVGSHVIDDPLLVSCSRAPHVNIGAIGVGAQPDPFNRCSIGADVGVSPIIVDAPLLVSCCLAPQVNIGAIGVGAQPDPMRRGPICANGDQCSSSTSVAPAARGAVGRRRRRSRWGRR